jgi:alginate O-acetyltransferase complex protein AlgI
MVFSSPLFLFLFLPVALTVYVLLPGLKARNAWLLLASIAFYAWGELGFVFLLLGSTVMNYGLGVWVERSQELHQRKFAVAVAILLNVGLLAFFKYANFAVASLNALLHACGLGTVRAPEIPLPIGISFFTFHALSYVVDIYRRNWRAAEQRTDVALYIFFFPQLIAGPILRWKAIGPQLGQRTLTREGFAEGIRRFAGGLAKKVLIANTVALPADQIFALPASELSASVAWLGIACYTLQIYFDFSGYSDMAVGMGKMFGFSFLENFQFPYVAQSVRDFWRRWHISLSSWFRDYVYIPLGGSRGSRVRTCLNLVVVFFLCGLWHGASLTFVAWGLYHGLFLALERTRFGQWQAKLPRILRHAYVVLAVMAGWVIFRANTFPAAADYFRALSGITHAPFAPAVQLYLTGQVICALALGIAFSGPLWDAIQSTTAKAGRAAPAALRPLLQATGSAAETCLVVASLVVSSAWLAGGTYNPFIYFRF